MRYDHFHKLIDTICPISYNSILISFHDICKHIIKRAPQRLKIVDYVKI